MIVSEGTCHRMRIPASSVQGITAGGGGFGAGTGTDQAFDHE